MPTPPPGPAPAPQWEASPVDLKWGVLFKADGNPTERWIKILGGLGQHLMDEFRPENTLVITPGKMAAFYSLHKLEQEIFPFTEIFRHPHNATLPDLYQRLACEYFLVPSEPNAHPTLPGLTLAGWTHWVTLFTQAYPHEEAQRLAKAVTALPINAPSLLDGKPERLPKQISRHLLPPAP
ncbi:hypothetical protein C8A05DRAFT_16584, partial [Staphylotrichum tortipilum]